jgi:spore coat polysaccharide biosynthesis protein SpsF
MHDAVIIIQARYRSRRFPGKVLLPLAGKAVLAHVVERCRAVPAAAAVVAAIPAGEADEPVAAAAAAAGAEVFRGAEDDVLARFAAAARAVPARHYVRITADCPLTDPALVSRVLAAQLAGDRDFSYNDVPAGFPRGYDVETLKAGVLFWLDARCRDATSREHITPYLFDHEADFDTFRLAGERREPPLRLVLDEPADYELLTIIFERLGGRPLFGLADVLALAAAEPALAEVNRRVGQKAPAKTPRVEK